MFAPISTASSGGSQTFNYYFKQFVNDSRFEIRLISCGKYSEKSEVEKETSNIRHEIIYWGDPSASKIQKIFNLESKFNLLNRNAGLVSNTEEKRIGSFFEKCKIEGYEPDIVILEWTNMVMLAGLVKKVFPKAKVVASAHDVTFIGYERKLNYYKGFKKFLWKIKYIHEKKLEINNLLKCDLVLPHNSDNKKALVKEGLCESKIQGLVPYYNSMVNITRNSNYRDILFFGAMSRPENSLSAKWFIDNVLDRLSDLDIRFVILGSNQPEDLRSLESDRIHVTGFVESTAPFFAESLCMVAPLVFGAGIKIKVLEALSSGIPVLTNRIGIEGIPAESGKEYYFCETPEEYEIIIRKLIHKEEDESMIGKRAQEFVSGVFSCEEFSQTYRDMVVELGDKK